ncbi:MAG: Ldh family oxidoreductase [Lachnospiraceae bacterium]|nr:Ldh family oxidoreductase [Lachnospiraceae bacterium]
MGYQYWSHETLHKLCTEAFLKFGFSERDTSIITDVLLTSDFNGVESHGVQRLARYHQNIKKGIIRVDAKAETVFETPVSAVIDGHDGMGQVIAYNAMKLAIEKAEKSGIAMVTVRNSNHYGIAGYYAKMAAKEGLMGISCTNTNPIMVPTHGKRAMLGTNPIGIAIPAEPYDFYFDSSTTVVTRGKLEVYNKLGYPMPSCWAVDEKGQGCSDAGRVLANIAAHRGGGILPLGGDNETTGGHKGYGWAMVCEIFSSIISMGTTSNETGKDGRGQISHGFAAINPAIFGDAEAIKKHLSDYLEKLRTSPLADGAERIYTHGEKEALAGDRIIKDGIPVNDNTMIEIMDLCTDIGLDFSEYFGDYTPPESGFKGNPI